MDAEVFEVWLDGVAVTVGDFYVERAGRYANVARLADVRDASERRFVRVGGRASRR